MRRMHWTFSALLALLLAPVASNTPATAAERNPVVFVHGWNGFSSNWNEMMADFRAAGYTDAELLAWDYNSSQSNKTTAEEFAGVVDDLRASTGADEVDVVSHSMGGLNTRWYLKSLDGTSKVADWVSLGGPNHGTRSAETCFDQSCEEMRIGSPFLTELNSDDESPAGTRYGTWWSECDGVIAPPDSTVVEGAVNTKTDCITHMGLLSDDIVSQQVRTFVG